MRHNTRVTRLKIDRQATLLYIGPVHNDAGYADRYHSLTGPRIRHCELPHLRHCYDRGRRIAAAQLGRPGLEAFVPVYQHPQRDAG